MESEAKYIRVGIATILMAALLVAGMLWLAGRSGQHAHCTDEELASALKLSDSPGRVNPGRTSPRRDGVMTPFVIKLEEGSLHRKICQEGVGPGCQEHF